MPDLILASSVTIEVTGPAPVVWEQVEPSPVTVGVGSHLLIPGPPGPQGPAGPDGPTGSDGPSDHGALTGLNDDDHALYALADGTRGAFAAPLGADDNYVTDAEKAALHAHSNKAALDLVSGTNTGDQVLPTWSTISGKPAVVAEGATQAEARTAIGLGSAATTASTAYATAAQGAKADSAVQPGDLVVNVRDFGAVGDGVVDDTAAIQAAINSLTGASSSGEFGGAGAGQVFLPKGSYKVTNLTMKSNVSIRGAGYRATALIATGTSGYTLGTSGLSHVVRIANVEISDLTIGPTLAGSVLDVTRPAVGGINLNYSQWCSLRNVFIHNVAGVGIDLTQTFDINTHNVHLMYVGTDVNAALLMAGDADDTCNANHHVGMRIERCPMMVKMTGAINAPVNNEFVACKFEWNVAGQPTTTGPGIYIEHGIQLKFVACMFVSDSVTYPVVSLGSAGAGPFTRGVRFVACEWNTPTLHQGWALTTTARCDDLLVADCDVDRYGKGFVLNPVTRGTFIGNRTDNCAAPVIDGVGLQVIGNRFLDCYTATGPGGLYAVRVSSNSRVIGNHIQGPTATANRPEGLNTSNNTLVIGNFFDRLNTAVSFFGTGAKSRANQFSSVNAPQSPATSLTNSIESPTPSSLTYSRAGESAIDTQLRTALVAAGLAYDNTTA